MAKLSALLINRPADAPPGGFVVQLVLGDVFKAAQSGHTPIMMYPEQADVTPAALADALRDLALWIERDPESTVRWYAGALPTCATPADSPSDPCGVCEHTRADHGEAGCNGCRKFGSGTVCMRFRSAP